MKEKKEIAFIGLGTMGVAMSAHLVGDGYTVHGFDISEDARNIAREQGIIVHTLLKDCVNAIEGEKVVWIMVPAKHVDEVLEKVRGGLKSGDCIIDGGNSFFKESVFRQHDLEGRDIDFIDCGTSGSVQDARFVGSSLMVGGDTDVVKKHEHIFKSLAVENGFGHVGGPGSGHFVKMIHNGIEYGMMGAIAEGLNVLHEHKEGMQLNIKEAIKAYEHGSIIESNLISWFADAYEKEGYLEGVAGLVPKVETEMDMEYLVENNRLRVLNAAIEQRKITRIRPSMIGTYISAMISEFGGRKPSKDKDSD